MKEIYNSPKVEVIELEIQDAVLEGSDLEIFQDPYEGVIIK